MECGNQDKWFRRVPAQPWAKEIHDSAAIYCSSLDDITAYAQCATKKSLKWLEQKQNRNKNQTNYLQIVGPFIESHKLNAWHKSIIEYLEQSSEFLLLLKRLFCEKGAAIYGGRGPILWARTFFTSTYFRPRN